MDGQLNECWLGYFVILQGIRTIFAKKHYSFVFRGGPDSLPTSGFAHEILPIGASHKRQPF